MFRRGLVSCQRVVESKSFFFQCAPLVLLKLDGQKRQVKAVAFHPSFAFVLAPECVFSTHVLNGGKRIKSGRIRFGLDRED